MKQWAVLPCGRRCPYEYGKLCRLPPENLWIGPGCFYLNLRITLNQDPKLL